MTALFRGRRCLGVVLGAVAVLAGAAEVAAAQTAAAARAPQETRAARTDRYADVRLTELIGMDVHDNLGRRIGDIEDVAIDLGTGAVRYAVLGYARSLYAHETASGARRYAYPTSAFLVDLREGALRLALPDARIRRADGFDPADWPATGAPSRTRGEQGGAGGGGRAVAANLVRGTELLGKAIDDADGDDIGTVHDLVLNLGQREVQFVVLEYDRAWSFDDKLVAVPMSAFAAPASQAGALTLRRQREQVRDAPGFDRSRWPDFTQEGLRERYEGFWNTPPTPQRSHSAAFKLLDKNGDGLLTADEYEAGQRVGAGKDASREAPATERGRSAPAVDLR